MYAVLVFARKGAYNGLSIWQEVHRDNFPNFVILTYNGVRDAFQQTSNNGVGNGCEKARKIGIDLDVGEG